MSKQRKWIILIGAILVLSLLATGCGSTDTTTTPGSTTPVSGQTNAPQDTVLTIIKDTQTVTYTMEALKSLPAITGLAGQMSSTGTITGPFNYKGVALLELLNAVGGITENHAVRVTAKDGYAMTISHKQATEGNFTVIDSNTGKEIKPAKQPVVFVAYEEDGKPISENIGPLRLGIMTGESEVTEGHWWVKWTQKIEVIPVQAPWNLKLEGAVIEDMDHSTFESGAAIGCHGIKYTDDQGQAWEGIPLRYLIGRVDDTTDVHKGDAFSDAAADEGYEVQVIASDGYTATFTAEETRRNNNMLVAYKVGGKTLSGDDWPLRLVGSAVDKKRQVGGIVSIKLVFGGSEPQVSATPIDEGPVILTVTSGSQSKTFSMAALKALPELSGFAGTKNKAGVVTGPLAYKGVSLTDLLSQVGGLSQGKSVKVTAKDGYAKTITYTQIMQADFSTYDTSGQAAEPEEKPVLFLAYEKEGAELDSDTGPLQLGIMTCHNRVTDGSWWVKQIEKIEIIDE